MKHFIFLLLICNYCFCVVEIGVTKLSYYPGFNVTKGNEYRELKNSIINLITTKLENFSTYLNSELQDSQTYQLYDAKDLVAAKHTNKIYEISPDKVMVNAKHEDVMQEDTHLHNGKYILIVKVIKIDSNIKIQNIPDSESNSMLLNINISIICRLIDTTNELKYFDFDAFGHSGISRIIPQNKNYMPNYNNLASDMSEQAIKGLLMDVKHNFDLLSNIT